MRRATHAKCMKRRLSDATTDAAKPSRKPARRSNAPRCFCGRRYRHGSRMGISSLRLGTGTDPQPSQTSIGSLTKVTCRPPSDGSYRKCLKSWTFIHNETVNIFSHFIGLLLFFTLPIGVYKELAPRYATADRADVFVFATSFLGAAICFALSTM